MLLQVGAQIWSDILSGASEARPHLLTRFLLLAHGDLKHFVHTYWSVTNCDRLALLNGMLGIHKGCLCRHACGMRRTPEHRLCLS